MQQTTTSSGIGFVGLLTVLFIGLKLTGHIAWSWWIVLTTPIWASVAVFLVGFILALAFFALAFLWQQSMRLWRG